MGSFSIWHWLTLFGLPAAVVFFFGAKKAGKNPILWGCIGAFAILAPIIVLSPIAWDLVHSSGDGGSVLYSYFAIVFAIAVAVAVAVYKRVMLKPSSAKHKSSTR